MIPLKPFYFLRHGQTEWNRINRIMGQQDISLNEKGRQQAMQAADLLRKEDFSIIITSPLERAFKTADIIAQELSKPYFIKENLKECTFGVKEGENYGEWVSSWKEGVQFEQAEPFGAFKQRVGVCIKEILEEHQEPVLIVSHGGVYSVIAQWLHLSQTTLGNGVPVYHRPPAFSNQPWFSYEC